jgi:glycosyltransferase involved in cell wall biosynthesis
MPWLLWNFHKQTWSNKELVIVDSSSSSSLVSGEGLRIVPGAPGSKVPQKRNLALEVADGEWIAWFDDDDWQHPDRLRILASALIEGAVVAGPQSVWLIDLPSAGCDVHTEFEQRIVFNAAGLTAGVARSRAFPTEPVIGSETVWLDALAGDHGPRVRRLADATLTALLCHHQNLCNPSGKRQLEQPISALRSAVGRQKWADTDAQLDELRARVTDRHAREQSERAALSAPPPSMARIPYRLFR